MKFSFSKSQLMMQKSAREFIKKECQDSARQAENEDAGFSKTYWKQLAELGWLGIGVSERYDGMGGDLVDLVILLQEMGRSLVPGPFIASGVCASYLIHQFGSDEQKQMWLPDMVNAEKIVVPAFIQPETFRTDFVLEDKLTESDDASAYLFSGTRMFVPYAGSADSFLVWLEGSDNTGSNVKNWFWIEANRPGIQCETLETIALDKQGVVTFENVVIPKRNGLGNPAALKNSINGLRDIGALAHSGYILGMLEQVLDMTVDYAKSRVQFDKPIGQFQAIQHQCADMMIDLEQVRNLTYQAAWRTKQDLSATKEISMAKARASDAARRICLMAIKIHGGIGIIDEYDLQLYFRHAKAMEQAFGDGDDHREFEV